ncbi:hypothetical protein CASFOL_021634 [Castilleja foliolosa]|uniref:Pollen Ole e 1 allergen and extensin family protein n=1 Tax=Castilleja foliolosa TaxID=1961234 RepID=A0ABD3CX46_9LAMI
MASKLTLVLVGLLFAAIALYMSEAQTMGSPNNGFSFNLLGVQVTLYCTPDGNMGIFGLATPPFKGANVMLQCGNNQIITTSTTNSYGITYMVTNPLPIIPFFPPQSNCKLVVNTTLSSCNPTLPSTGFLQSPLGFLGTSTIENKKVANFAPSGFHYIS